MCVGSPRGAEIFRTLLRLGSLLSSALERITFHLTSSVPIRTCPKERSYSTHSFRGPKSRLAGDGRRLHHRRNSSLTIADLLAKLVAVRLGFRGVDPCRGSRDETTFCPGSDHPLVIYALDFASRTRLPVKVFQCAWFDEKDYFEFFPLQAIRGKREQAPV